MSQPVEEPRKSSLATLRGLVPFLVPYKRQFAMAGVALLVAAGATLAIPYAFKQMSDLGFGGAGTKSIRHVDLYFLALFGVASVLAVATAARFYAVSWLGERVTADIRNAVYSHVVSQSPQFFEITRSGEVLSRLTTDTTLIQAVVGTSISMALRNALLFVGGLAMMFVTSPKLSSIIIVLLVAVVLPIIMFGRRVRRLSRDSQDRIADASAMAGEILNAMTTVQAFTHEGIEAERFQGSVERAFLTAIRRIRARSLLTLIAILLVFGAIVFVLWLGAHAVIQGTMTGGELGQFILYSVLVAGAVGALAEVLGEAQRAAGATERLMELMEERSPIQSPEHPVALPPRTRTGAALAISDVTFNYRPARNRRRSRISPSRCSRARPSPWWGPRARARPRYSSCCCVSTIRRRARSRSMASRSARSACARCASRSASCPRTPCSPPPRRWRIPATAGPTRPTRG